VESKLLYKIRDSFKSLKNYCEKENFAGWDPYDGLNSKIFDALPFKHWDFARLAWIQGFKRCPINFRRLMLVPKEHNSMGIGLFLQGYCNLYQVAKSGNLTYGNEEELLSKINELSELLISMKTEGYSGTCWGYNFDWQSRRLFLFPKYTPTVVATAFCALGLYESYEITKNENYLNVALSSAKFVTEDLSRTPYKSGFIFSYSPFNGNNTVFNASLLGAKLLSIAYRYTKEGSYKQLAKEAIMGACDGQEEDGSWVYGLLPTQQWKDSFHTGFNLEAIEAYQQNTGDTTFQKHIEKGFDFYLEHFFEKDGTPKYYHDKTYPIDIHCPGQLLVTLSQCKRFSKNRELADKVTKWTIENMQNKKGFFYYQLKKGISSKISYMRWSNAFMFNAMSYYIVEENN